MTQYQWNPSDYNKHSSQQALWARELINKLHLQGSEAVLDIGCGDGKMTAELGRAVPQGRVTGIDSSAQMVEFARQQFPPAEHPNLDFSVMNALVLTFQEEFDVVFSNATLHWVNDHPAVLGGIARALRPGGRILLQMGGRGNASEVIATLDSLSVHPAWREYFTGFGFPFAFFGPEEYREWLAGAGLEPVRVELLVKDMVHTGAGDLMGWGRTTWLPYTQRVPEEKREQFLSEFTRRYLADHPLDEAGQAHVRMVRLEVEARKR